MSSLSTIAFTSVYQACKVFGNVHVFMGGEISDDVGVFSFKLCFIFCNQDTIKLLY